MLQEANRGRKNDIEKKSFLQLSELIYGFLAGEQNFRQFFLDARDFKALRASKIPMSERMNDMCFC